MKKLVLILLLFSGSVLARPIISDLSQKEILVDAGFSGTKLFLFGNKNSYGEVVVVVKGPKQNYVVRKKENIGGVWLNRKQMKFENVHGFYGLFSSIKETDLERYPMLSNLNIGVKNLPLSYTGKAYIDDILDFRKAILDDKDKDVLYYQNYDAIDFIGDSLFKVNLNFPKKIPHGIYNAEVYLVTENELLGVQSIPIEVKKVGIESFIHNFAHESPFLYGVMGVLAAIFMGWFASLVFWKV
jgi:uncharacterized protein (TIGR02186 family)